MAYEVYTVGVGWVHADLKILEWLFEALVLDGSGSNLHTIKVNVHSTMKFIYSEKYYTLKKTGVKIVRIV